MPDRKIKFGCLSAIEIVCGVYNHLALIQATLVQYNIVSQTVKDHMEARIDSGNVQ